MRIHKAFTITELLLVASGLGLLTTFVLPLPQQMRQQQRQSGCLGNLGRLGAASLAYATEDPRRQFIPLHVADATSMHEIAWPMMGWGWRTAAPHVFGGQTATVPFPTDEGDVTVMLDAYWGEASNPWSVATRPLNALVDGGGGSLQSFHCPADAGYPIEASLWHPDIPGAAAGISCFEMVGNSYRSNRTGGVFASGARAVASLQVSPFGHTPDQVLEPQRTVLYSDPLFYSVARQLSPSVPMDPIAGWHGSLMADNVGYCDGSARLTEIGDLREFSDDEVREMLGKPGYGEYLRRGSTWQMDSYPAPASVTVAYRYYGTHAALYDVSHFANDTGWPFDRFTRNQSPFAARRDAQPANEPATVEHVPGRWVSQ